MTTAIVTRKIQEQKKDSRSNEYDMISFIKIWYNTNKKGHENAQKSQQKF